MPFCRHGEAHQTMAMVDAAMDHCTMHDPQPVPDDHSLNCDDCGFCHLAAAGMMPTPERIADVLAVGRDFRAETPQAPASAIPEPPQQPPKRLT